MYESYIFVPTANNAKTKYMPVSRTEPNNQCLRWLRPTYKLELHILVVKLHFRSELEKCPKIQQNQHSIRLVMKYHQSGSIISQHLKCTYNTHSSEGSRRDITKPNPNNYNPNSPKTSTSRNIENDNPNTQIGCLAL